MAGATNLKFPPTHEDGQSGNVYEFLSDDEGGNLSQQSGIRRDIEGGHFSSVGRDKQAVELDFKSYALYLLTMTCGFMASIFIFNVGIGFFIQCPGKEVLPYFLIIKGVSGALPQLYIISKLLGSSFYGFRRFQEKAIQISFIILLLQWSIEIFFLHHMNITYDYSRRFCKPKFYRYNENANLIAILAYVLHFVINFSYQKTRRIESVPSHVFKRGKYY